jgi:hypothetical protein
MKSPKILAATTAFAALAMMIGSSVFNVHTVAQDQKVEICGDGIDNDGDKLIDEDCPNPPVGCAAIVLPEPTNPNKVTLCHFTGSDGNPFIINEVSASAALSHADHHGDCVNPADGPTVCVP